MTKLISFLRSLSIYTKLAFLIFVLVSFLSTTAIMLTSHNSSKQTNTIVSELVTSVIAANENLILEFILTDNSWKLYKFLLALSQKTTLINNAGFIDNNNIVIAHTSTNKYSAGDEYKYDKKEYKIPFETQGLKLGYFVLDIHKQSIITMIEETFITNLFFILIAAIFSFLIANVFMRKLLSRLSIVTLNAKAIAKHEWQKIMPYRGKANDEITDLISTIESLMHDIKTSIENIEEQKNFYHNILQNVDSLIIICNKKMELTYQSEHPLSKSILIENNEKIEPNILRTIVFNINNNNKSFFIPISSTFKESDVQQSVLVNLQHIKNSIVLSFSDMTQIKQNSDNEKVINSLKVLGEISSLFAHEIKNLIQPLKLLLPKDEIPDKEDIAIVNLTIDKIDKQIMDYLLLRKPIDKNITEAVKIMPILDNLVLVFKKALEEKTLKLMIEISDNAMAYMHPESIELIMINLLKNAIEASFPNTVISIEWKDVDDKLGVFSIENSCHALTPHMKKNLFKPFFTTKKEGTGLGLFLVYRIVYLSNGYINVNHKNNSIVFSLYIPKKKSL